LINRGYWRAFFWDGRATSLEEQVVKPIEDPNELGSPLIEAAARVGVPATDIACALSSFVRSILSENSRFDSFINGDRQALTTDEQEGLQLFRGKRNCAACHLGPNLTDEKLHNTGVAWRGQAVADAGRGAR
jgi:cytochrome c peroxidase